MWSRHCSRPVTLGLAVVLALAACGDNRKAGVLTPEQVVATGKDGQEVVVEGLVHALTFETDPQDGGDFTELPDRFLLVRTVVPAGVTLEDLDSGNILQAWGLGVRLPAATLDDGPLPPIGARVRITGTYQHRDWAGRSVPMVEDAIIEVLEGQVTLGMLGATCDNDLDCHERFICDRATLACANTPGVIPWESEWHGINGACLVDADCPLSQRCETKYTLAMEGVFAPPYFVTRDAGKHVCVPNDGATLADLCPRIYSTRDLSGGRFVTGKEVCVEGETWLDVAAEDGDTHLQLTIDEPLPYPEADTAYWIFGSTTENVPPYKDPSRPQGAILDPEVGDRVIAVGTVHFDVSHGWFELHPVKQYFAATGSRDRGTAAMQKRYPTHPGDVSLEDIEHGRVPGGGKVWEKRSLKDRKRRD